jgi:dihydrofolate reductase
MGKIVVLNHLTLDGVMQAPGRTDEDLRGGFQRGGWAIPNNDEVMFGVMAKGLATESALLVGRRTFQALEEGWANVGDDNPYAVVINKQKKYVASRTLGEPLSWTNATLLKGEVTEAVARLKDGSEIDLVVLGSGELIQTLMRGNLVDRYLLMIHPMVLGTGMRMFPDGGVPADLRLVDVKPTTKGVLLATYLPAEAAEESPGSRTA